MPGARLQPEPQKNEAALASGRSLGRKRPRRAYGDKSPRALDMLRRTKKQGQKPAGGAKAPGLGKRCHPAFPKRIEIEIGKLRAASHE
jgi:hypothetical protein